uniref:Crumbs cell polarity complex component 2 n=1 Tax=Latimeria chalumnae TaxID=7897 RepID=H3BHZ4_LATCH
MDFFLSTIAYLTEAGLILKYFLTGALCSEYVHKCSSAPCQNNGTCVELDHDYNCMCPDQPVVYIGKNCEHLYNKCSIHPCPNNSSCSSTPGLANYNCSCTLGATGLDCYVQLHKCESNPCSGLNYECKEYTNGYSCQCRAGYTGEDCKTSTLKCSTNLCQNNGTCVETGAENYTCLCEPGYLGVNCEVDINECDSSPCKNGAICVNKANGYNCFCVPGFQGYNCEIDINECASRPCQNNGTCFNEMDGYLCKCILGYTGINCEVEINECESDPCQNGGTCRDHVGFYTCTCAPGYKGDQCQIDIDECASQPCNNRGTCHDSSNRYICNCSGTGFMGENCEIDILECASDPCVNNATCQEGVNNYTCLCWNGYTGRHCEIDINECDEGPCLNGGICYERSNQSYYGSLSEFNYKFSYRSAAGYICCCQPGFTGEDCSINIDECESQPCQNGGTCEDLIDKFNCFCTPGFTDVTCGSNINECEQNPCKNGGTCKDGIADYSCLCLPMDENGIVWGGKNCSIQLSGCQEDNCHNGGLCIPSFENEIHGYTCKCPPGFYDDTCSTPTTFSFTSPGYVIVEMPTNNRSKRDEGEPTVSIGLRFKTTLPNMVIAYRGDETEYLFLELFNGHMHAALKSDNTTPTLFIEDQLVNDGKWYEAMVVLNDSLQLILWGTNCSDNVCIAQHSIEDHAQLLINSFKTIYIGGLNDSLLSNTRSRESFVGCMEDFKLDSRIVLPQTVSESMSFQMTLGCNKTEWCNSDPCSGKGHCVDLWTSSRCDCFRPHTGPNCSYEYIPATFGKEGARSFALFNITDNSEAKFSVSFFIRTLKPKGVILQINNTTASYFTVYLSEGKIHVKSLSPHVVTLDKNLADGLKHFISINVSTELVTLSFNQSETVQSGRLTSIKLGAGDAAYVGGTPYENDLNKWGGYFKGCLQDMRITEHQLEFFLQETDISVRHNVYKAEEINNITQGCVSDNTCNPHPCRNGGTCKVLWNDFVCSCPMNFTGRTCKEKVWCASNPCPIQSQCQNIPGGYECLANATFQDNNMVAYITNGSITKDLTVISLDIRTRDTDANLLQATNGAKSLWIGLQNSELQVRIRSGNILEDLDILSKMILEDGLWHRVNVSMEEPSAVSSRWIVCVDGVSNMTTQGTAGNLNFLNENTVVVLAENFTGCLGQVRIGGIHLPFIEGQTFPQQEQFFKHSGGPLHLECVGADVCSQNPCFNNGQCEDQFNSFSCNCSAGWEGSLCESNINDCKSTPCFNGNCSDLIADYTCDCFPGFNGRNCELNVDDCLEHQCQNGGTCIDGENSYSCNCDAQYTGYYCEWLYPPVQCGKDFSCLNGGQCTNGAWGANCTCKPGFTGEKCETNINDCSPSPCQNGGTCQDFVNKYECICGANFTGEHCEIDKEEEMLQIPLIAVAVPVVCGCLLLLIIGLIFMVLTARKKRQSEGTYSPSQQEVAGARLEMDSVLKVPPEERLI